MVKQIVGDLIKSAKKGEFEVIAHQCNCFNTMGSGIAKSIKDEWQEASDVDDATTKGDMSKLGTITFTKNTTPIIVNLYGQFDYWSKGVLTDYASLQKSLIEMKQKFPGKKIGMPKIGSLRARGDWSVILPIIEKVFCDTTDDVTIVEWEQDVATTKSANNSLSNNTNYGNQTGAIAKLSAFSKPNTPTSVIVPKTTISSIVPILPAKKKFRGKRKCKVCNTSHSTKDMFNYLPSVWVCKVKCHGIFMDKLNKIITQASIDIAKNNPQSILNSSIAPYNYQQTPLPKTVNTITD